MGRNWHNFSAKEHGFLYSHTEGSHEFYVKKENGHFVVQVIVSSKERHRQSRNTMQMSMRHSGISKIEYVRWINAQ